MNPRRATRWALALGQLGLVVTLALGVVLNWFPLGVPGEWIWQRVPFPPQGLGVLVAALAVLVYAGFVAGVLRSLTRFRPGFGVEVGAVVGLFAAAIAVQLAVSHGAALGFGLTRWIALAVPSTSGYHTVAREQVGDPWSFWAEYPRWIRGQDSLHIGTHPPGLILWAEFAQRRMDAQPGLAALVNDLTPESVSRGFREILGPLPPADRAAIVLTGALTLLACAGTVVPLYALARTSMAPAASWAAAGLWPLAPSAVLFQPTADTAYPLLATTALALAAWSLRWVRGGRAGAVCAGVVLGIGMQLTLAFLAVGLVAALVIVGGGTSGRADDLAFGVRFRIERLLAVGVGFLAVTLGLWALSGANPFVIWWWNQVNHARFYDEYTRTYATWVVMNPVELAIGLGLPVALWAVVGLWTTWDALPVMLMTVLVLILLTLGGRNLSEVARLWLPLMPPLLLAAGAGMDRLRAGAVDLGWTVALLGVQMLLLQATIQVVYPV